MQPQISCSKIMADSAAISPASNNASSRIASISIFDEFNNCPVGFLSTLKSMTGKQGVHPFENINPPKGSESESAEDWISFFANIENNMSHMFSQGHINNMNPNELTIPLNSDPENITALEKQFIQPHDLFDGEGNNYLHRDTFALLSNLNASESGPGIPAKKIPLNLNRVADTSTSIELMNATGVDKGNIASETVEESEVKANTQSQSNFVTRSDKTIKDVTGWMNTPPRPVPDSKSGELDRQTFSVQKEIEPHPVRPDKADPVHLRRSASEAQTHEEHESKPAISIIKNRVLSINAGADHENPLKARVTENLNKVSDSQKKEIVQLHEEKAPDSGGRFAIDLSKVHRPFIIDSASMQRFIANNHSLQKTQTPGAILNVKQLVSSESGTGEETTLASNHQNQDKNAGSVVQSKEIHYFDRSFQPTVIKQVVDKAILSLKNGQSSIKLSLRPDVLGQLKMHISTDNSQVSIRIITDVPMVKDIIESNLTQLKADFQNQGLEIEKFDVSVGQGSTYNNGTSGSFPFQEKISAGVEGTVQAEISEDSQENAHHAEMQNDSSQIDYFA